MGRNFHLDWDLHPSGLDENSFPRAGKPAMTWQFLCLLLLWFLNLAENVMHHNIFDISGNWCEPWNSTHTFIDIYIGHKVVNFSTKTTLLDHLGDLYVGGGDTAFFKKMNISIEWTIRLFFEWINSLNEYFCRTIEWINSLNEYFCRTIEWIFEWIKKLRFEEKRAHFEEKRPILHVFPCFLKLRLFFQFE